jgi:V/A-type H+-transporting ATPase subunit E
MDANQVVQKILAQARAEAEKIKAEANEKIKTLKAANEEELSRYRQESQRLAPIAGEEKKNRVLAAARIAIAREMTETKRKLLNTAIEKAGQKIKSLNDGEYLSIMEGLILRSVKTGNEEVVIGRNEKRINENFIGNINQKLAGAGKGNLRLAPDRADIEAGFILRQNKMQVNAGLDVLLKVAGEQLEGKLAEQLFG